MLEQLFTAIDQSFRFVVELMQEIKLMLDEMSTKEQPGHLIQQMHDVLLAAMRFVGRYAAEAPEAILPTATLEAIGITCEQTKQHQRGALVFVLPELAQLSSTSDGQVAFLESGIVTTALGVLITQLQTQGQMQQQEVHHHACVTTLAITIIAR